MREFKKNTISGGSFRDISEAYSICDRHNRQIWDWNSICICSPSFSILYEYLCPHPAIEIFEKEVAEGAEKKLYEFKEKHFADFPDTQTAVVLGDAAEEILKYVKSEGMDLIIMSSHGRKGLDKVIFRSVAEKVVKTAPVPVMVANPYTIVT